SASPYSRSETGHCLSASRHAEFPCLCKCTFPSTRALSTGRRAEVLAGGRINAEAQGFEETRRAFLFSAFFCVQRLRLTLSQTRGGAGSTPRPSPEYRPRRRGVGSARCRKNAPMPSCPGPGKTSFHRRGRL